MPETSEDRRDCEPALAERLPGPAAASLAEEKAEWMEEEACRASCSTQQESCANSCHEGDTGSELKPKTEVWGWEPRVPSEKSPASPTGATL